MIPAIIHQCFLRPPMPKEFDQYVAGLRAMNPAFRYIMWTMDNIWELGLTEADLPFDNPVWNSDIIRLHAVSQLGGIYMDCDFEAMKPLDPLIDHEAFAAIQHDGQVNNGIFGAQPHHPWVEWQLENLRSYIPRCREWGVLLSTEAPRAGLTLIEPQLVYPFWHTTPLHDRRPHADSIVVHHWAGSWLK